MSEPSIDTNVTADASVLPTASPNRPGRNAAGQFQKGHALTVTHALSALTLPPELAHLREEIAAYEAASLVDDGNADDLPIRRRSLHTYRARVHRRILQLDDAIEIRGLVDRRGRLRVAWLSKLETLIASAVRLDTLLGLERRQKPVQSFAELLNELADQEQE